MKQTPTDNSVDKVNRRHTWGLRTHQQVTKQRRRRRPSKPPTHQLTPAHFPPQPIPHSTHRTLILSPRPKAQTGSTSSTSQISLHTLPWRRPEISDLYAHSLPQISLRTDSQENRKSHRTNQLINT